MGAQSGNPDYREDLSSSDENLLDQFDLQHYLRTLRKHKWLIVLFSTAVTMLAGYYAYTATPVYQSTSTLLIESQGNNLVQFEELVGLDTENQDYYQTQFELLRSRGLAVRVVEHLNLWNHPDFSVENNVDLRRKQMQSGGADLTSSPLDDVLKSASLFLGSFTSRIELDDAPALGSDVEAVSSTGNDDPPVVTQRDGTGESSILSSSRLITGIESESREVTDAEVSIDRQKTVNKFMEKLTVTPVRKTKLVKISFESPDPVFAALVANTVGEQYIESYLDAKLELTTKASRWLNERLGSLKAVLESSEDRLIEFKQANGLVDVDGSVGRLNEQELLLTTAELAQARSDLAAQADLFREVQNLSGQPELLDSIPSVQADPLVQRVKIEQGQAQRELDELRNRYGDRHPRVVDAKSQLATINTTLQGHLVRVASSISKDYQLTRQRVATIESKLALGKREIQSLGTKKFELDELEREVQTNRDIYNAFFSRITEAKSADGLESANARISDEAVPGLNPVKPKKQLIIALAAIASLFLAVLMAILYEQMDDTVKSTEDVEGILGLKLLGILPLVKGGVFSRARVLPLNPVEISDEKGRFAEAVNTTRTAVCMGDQGGIRKVIAVTSSVPGEGKSSTSINLAYSLAQLERVLIIDCDMRKPTIAKAAGFDKNVTGLSSLISKMAPASECIKQGVFGGGVDILPSGPIPEQPLELLSSKRFEKIVSQLSTHYDRIIIDCAPTQAVSDALVISRLTDAVIYCIKSQDTSMGLVRRGIQRLKQVQAPLAGAIITQVDIDKIASYGGDYYYQGYYDYYGYSEKGEKGRRGGKLKLTQEELHRIRNEDDDSDLDFSNIKRSVGHYPKDPSDRYIDYDDTSQLQYDSKHPKTDYSGKGKKSALNGGRLRRDLDIL